MRLWSIHPRYLDAMGLNALWREALLAQKVLQKKVAANPIFRIVSGDAEPWEAIKK